MKNRFSLFAISVFSLSSTFSSAFASEPKVDTACEMIEVIRKRVAPDGGQSVCYEGKEIGSSVSCRFEISPCRLALRTPQQSYVFLASHRVTYREGFDEVTEKVNEGISAHLNPYYQDSMRKKPENQMVFTANYDLDETDPEIGISRALSDVTIGIAIDAGSSRVREFSAEATISFGGKSVVNCGSVRPVACGK